MIEIGNKIKELRISKNLTQKDLANQLHVTPQAVSKWEREESIPDLETLITLCQYFDYSLEKLLGIKRRNFLTVLFSKWKGTTSLMNNQTLANIKAQNKQIKNKQTLVMIFDLTENFLTYESLPFTQVFAAKLTHLLNEKEPLFSVQTYSSNTVASLAEQADIILLTPALTSAKEKIKHHFPTIPVFLIDKKIYGLMNVAAVADQIFQTMDA